MTLPSSLLPTVNIAILVLLVLMLLYGYFKGFLLQVFNLVMFIAVCFVSWMIAPGMAKTIPLMRSNEQFNVIPIIGPIFQQTINTILWFILIVVALMVISLFFKPVIKGIGKLPIIKTVNHILGLLLGGLKAFIILILVMLILEAGWITNGRDFVNGSYLSLLKPVSHAVVSTFSSRLDPSGFIARIMTGSEFTPDEVLTLNAWLADKGVPSDVVPILSKVLRLEAINPTQLNTLVDWMRLNGISEEDLQNFLDRAQ